MSFIGPALPPHLMTAARQEEGEEDAGEEEKSPPPPPEPPAVAAEEEEEPDLYGPALPPGFQAAVSQPRIIGPTLPPGINLGQAGEESSDDDGDIVGPMPVPGDPDHANYLEQQFESRAARMKSKLTDQGKEGRPERESWMTDLPKNRTGLIGLEARSFRKSAGPDKNADTSEWTDTPADKLRKAQLAAQGLVPEGPSNTAEELEAIALQERDKAMAKRAAKHASKRAAESLVEMHQKELNKKKKEEADKKQERRMFDREKDLQVNKFDDAQKRAVLTKAKFLDDRFSAGNQKFL